MRVRTGVAAAKGVDGSAVTHCHRVSFPSPHGLDDHIRECVDKNCLPYLLMLFAEAYADVRDQGGSRGKKGND